MAKEHIGTIEEEEQKLNRNFIRIDFGRQANLFFAILSIGLIFFGILCNKYEKNLGENLIWLYRIIFRTYYGLPVIILFIICFILTYREDVYLYGIKNSLWLVPIVILMSILWYFIIYGVSMIPFQLLFLSYRGYLNFIVLCLIHFLGAFCGMKAKEFILARRKI